MIDRLFTAVLAFCVLIASTAAIASAWFDSRSAERVVRLPAVNIVAKRALPVNVATGQASATRTVQ